MESLYYIGILILVIGIVGFGYWGKRKYNIKDDELNMAMLVISVIKYITSQFKFNNSELVEKVLYYVIEAMAVIQEYDGLPIEERNELIRNEAIEICKLEGIVVDDEIVELIDGILKYFEINKIIVEASK